MTCACSWLDVARDRLCHAAPASPDLPADWKLHNGPAMFVMLIQCAVIMIMCGQMCAAGLTAGCPQCVGSFKPVSH